MIPLHFFMFMLFIIGLLLIIISFFAYSKLKSECTSSSLKTKLRIAIAIGSALFAIAIGYFYCINDSHCQCSFDLGDRLKINIMVGFSLLAGVGLLILTLGIKTELKNPNCTVDLGILPTMLIVLSAVQIVGSVGYIIRMVGKGFPPKQPKIVEQEDSDDTIEINALARKTASEQRLTKKLNAQLLTKQADLSHVKESILAAKYSNKNPSKQDLEQHSKLSQEIGKINDDMSGIKNESSVSTSSVSGGSSVSGLDFGSL
jgi:hypothetical protein